MLPNVRFPRIITFPHFLSAQVFMSHRTFGPADVDAMGQDGEESQDDNAAENQDDDNEEVSQDDSEEESQEEDSEEESQDDSKEESQEEYSERNDDEVAADGNDLAQDYRSRRRPQTVRTYIVQCFGTQKVTHWNELLDFQAHLNWTLHRYLWLSREEGLGISKSILCILLGEVDKTMLNFKVRPKTSSGKDLFSLWAHLREALRPTLHFLGCGQGTTEAVNVDQPPRQHGEGDAQRLRCRFHARISDENNWMEVTLESARFVYKEDVINFSVARSEEWRRERRHLLLPCAYNIWPDPIFVSPVLADHHDSS